MDILKVIGLIVLVIIAWHVITFLLSIMAYIFIIAVILGGLYLIAD